MLRSTDNDQAANSLTAPEVAPGDSDAPAEPLQCRIHLYPSASSSTQPVGSATVTPSAAVDIGGEAGSPARARTDRGPDDVATVAPSAAADMSREAGSPARAHAECDGEAVPLGDEASTSEPVAQELAQCELQSTRSSTEQMTPHAACRTLALSRLWRLHQQVSLDGADLAVLAVDLQDSIDALQLDIDNAVTWSRLEETCHFMIVYLCSVAGWMGDDVNPYVQMLQSPLTHGRITREDILNPTPAVDLLLKESHFASLSRTVSYTHLTLPTTPYV